LGHAVQVRESLVCDALAPVEIEPRDLIETRDPGEDRVAHLLPGVDARQLPILDDADQHVPVAVRHRLARLDRAADAIDGIERRCGTERHAIAGGLRMVAGGAVDEPLPVVEPVQPREDQPRVWHVETGDARLAVGKRRQQAVLDELADLLDVEPAVEQVVQPLRGGGVAGAIDSGEVAGDRFVLFEADRGQRLDVMFELRPTLEAVLARHGELRHGERRARHSFETFPGLFLELLQRWPRRELRRGIRHSDLLSTAPASARQAERRSNRRRTEYSGGLGPLRGREAS